MILAYSDVHAIHEWCGRGPGAGRGAVRRTIMKGSAAQETAPQVRWPWQP